ncbi:Crp/Fnr family transcriptional regulator [Spirochaeta cellobiosiphila]|uniref:Crp/Fnr family transcriptional regulator n=1 Tax=Spirochaeta cellobiosiphila TaxID=504483 RepID=UPI0003F81096|nr:cyclic nucleotide-binding domain-containing protein [Spirochaeta cellobiosiphila]
MKVNKDVLAQNCREYQKDEIVFDEGQEGKEMFIILSGSVTILKKTSADAYKELITLNKGDMFGEMALIEQKKRSAMARAEETTKLLVLNEAAFFSFLESNPSFSIKIIKVLADRLRGANKIIQQILNTNTNKQIYEGLLKYSSSKGVSTYNGMRINVDAFTDWVCHNLGIVKESVPSALDSFMLRGLVKRSALGDSELLVPKSHSTNS